MGKFRKLAFYLMIPIFIVSMIEGGIYYQGKNLKEIENFLCSLNNTIKLLVGQPTIQSFAAFGAITPEYSDFEVTITYIYSIIVFIAPILMTTAIVAGFSAYFFDFINSIKISFRKRMFIIGDGQMSRITASKYAKKYYVHYMMPAETPNEDRVPLLKEKVRAYPVDFNQIRDYCKSAGLEKASYVVLNFKDWFASHSTAVDVIDYLVEHSGGRQLPVYIVDVPGVLHYIFESTYKGLCRKYDKDFSTLKFSIINVNDTNARRFFKDPGFTGQPGNRHHIVFVGMGGYGRAVFKELAAYMKTRGFTGTVDIFDKNVESGINNLMYSTTSIGKEEMFSLAPIAENAKFSADMKIDEGIIRFNFYQVTIGELKATEYLTAILAQEKVTEFFCCIEDVESCFECYRMIEGYGKEFDDTKLYFRLGPRMTNSFEAIRISSEMFEFLPDDFPDIELIDEDCDKETESLKK